MQLVLALFVVLITYAYAQQPCPQLKIKTSETVLDSPIPKERAPLWIAPDYTTVLTLTQEKVLWRSTDAGKTFAKVEFKDVTRIRDVQLSSDKKSILVSAENIIRLFTSTDGGATWNTIIPSGRMVNFKFHPTKPEWIIAIRAGCPALTNCSNDLYLSQDFGKNWMLLRTYVWVADWHKADDMIIAWERNYKGGIQDQPPFDTQVVKSAFFFRSPPTVIADEVLGYLASGNHIFIAKRESSGGLSLLASTDNGDTFHDTRFPGGLVENRYTILDTSEGATFVNVDHSNFGDQSNWGNIYSSDGFDADFSLSLEHNPRTPTGRCDFKRVQGIEGIYLANQFTKMANEQTQIGSAKQTLITFDKGGTWKRLPKPGKLNRDCVKEEDCLLNLFGNSNNGEWYSRPESVGMIISTGMVGPYIVPDTTELGVFFSRDAGLTWEFITNGSHTYEIGNRGAKMLMALDIELTNVIKYSVDEGLNWVSCGMTTTNFDVDDIVSDPKMQSNIFLVHGKRDGKGVIVQVDFNDIHEDDCIGYETPDTATSNYEIWEPSGTQANNCLLGRKTRFIRRKRSAACDNPTAIDTTKATIVKNCTCNEENYQCDYCFVRVGGLCVKDAAYCGSFDPMAPPSKCHDFYYETRGYRRVPGDTCDTAGGVDHLPIKKPCPYRTPEPAPATEPPNGQTGPNIKVDSHATSVIGFLVIFAFVALLIVVVWYLSGRNPTVRDYVSKCVPERFLPDFKIPAAAYSVLEEGVDGDAPALTIDDNDSDDKVQEEDKDHDENKITLDDSDFNPRG